MTRRAVELLCGRDREHLARMAEVCGADAEAMAAALLETHLRVLRERRVAIDGRSPEEVGRSAARLGPGRPR